MILNLTFLNIAEMFERMAYYGVRSIFILFLVKAIHWDREDAADWYGTFTFIVYGASIAGGLLSDFTRLPTLMAIIGNSITTVGIFTLAFSVSDIAIYCSSGLIALGSGVYKPSIIGSLYRVSFTHKHRFDFIYTVFYIAINFGAFLAPIIVGGIGDTGNPDDFRLGFLTAGCISLIPTALLAINYNNLISNDLLYNSQTYTLNDIGVSKVVLWFLISIIFWVAYELFPQFIGSDSSHQTTVIIAFLSIFVYLILLPLHLIRNFRSAWKIAVGLVLIASACTLIPLSGLPAIPGLILFVIAEVLVVPVMMSQIIQNSSPRLTATIMAAFMFVTLFTNKLVGVLSNATVQDQPIVLRIISILCFGLATVLLILDRIQRNRERNSTQRV